ncbi:MAG TPA: glycosyltransferase [Candidatus Methylomirabilis sp.]|nr:glycosyltransferase [Candidatus Methylomirabilis sp.]
MDVSIVVCTHNRAASLRLTLACLGAQVTPPHLPWEVMVVDNNSTDSTRREIETFAASASIPVRYLFAAPEGLSRARNVGLAESQAEIVAFTDDDVDPAPDWVARIAEAMTESRLDLLGGRIVPAWSEPPPRWLERRPYLANALAITDHPTPALLPTRTGKPAVWGANLAVRREVFAKVGRFDPRRGLIGTKLYGGEENDLIERALAAGFRVAYDPRVLVRHRIGVDRMRVGYFSRLYFQRAEGRALWPETRRRTPVARVRQARRWRDPLRLWLKCCTTLGIASGLCKRCFARAHG